MVVPWYEHRYLYGTADLKNPLPIRPGIHKAHFTAWWDPLSELGTAGWQKTNQWKINLNKIASTCQDLFSQLLLEVDYVIKSGLKVWKKCHSLGIIIGINVGRTNLLELLHWQINVAKINILHNYAIWIMVWTLKVVTYVLARSFFRIFLHIFF